MLEHNSTVSASPEDLLDVEAFTTLVGCSMAMAKHHIERRGLASTYLDAMPLVRRAEAEAFRLRHAEMQAAVREIAADTDDQDAPWNGSACTGGG